MDAVRVLAAFGAGQSLAAVQCRCTAELRGLSCTLRGLVIFAGVHGLLRWRRETLRPVVVSPIPMAMAGEAEPQQESTASAPASAAAPTSPPAEIPEQLRAVASLVFPGSALARQSAALASAAGGDGSTAEAEDAAAALAAA